MFEYDFEITIIYIRTKIINVSNKISDYLRVPIHWSILQILSEMFSMIMVAALCMVHQIQKGQFRSWNLEELIEAPIGMAPPLKVLRYFTSVSFLVFIESQFL